MAHKYIHIIWLLPDFPHIHNGSVNLDDLIAARGRSGLSKRHSVI